MVESTHRPGLRKALAWRTLSALAAVKLLVLAVVGSRYGFHRDELYYVVGGRRLELGYVDHPFLTPWLARLGEVVFGLSPTGLRVLTALAGALVVFLTGLIAWRMGGGGRAQIVAATATLLCGFYLMTANMFQTVPLDILAWTAGFLILAMLLASNDSRWWLAFGGVAGIGLLTKYTILVFGAGVVAGVVLARRRELARPWIYFGGAIALLLVLPNLLWQVDHGWPTLEFMANNHAAEKMPPLPFVAMQAVFSGPFSLPVLVAGFWFLFSKRGARFRVLGWVAVFVFGLFLVTQSKPYYAAPVYALLFAAGGVALEPRLEAAVGFKRHWPILLMLGNLLLLPTFLPVLPVATYARFHDGFPHPEFGEMIGWPELVRTVGEAYRELPAKTRSSAALLTANYGIAAALDLFGAEYGLPAAACGQNSYYYWSAPRSIDPAIAVGFPKRWLEARFGTVTELGVIENAAGIANQEAGRPFFLVRDAKLEPDDLWVEMRFFR